MTNADKILCDYLASRKNLEFRFDVEGSVDDSLGG